MHILCNIVSCLHKSCNSLVCKLKPHLDHNILCSKLVPNSFRRPFVKSVCYKCITHVWALIIRTKNVHFFFFFFFFFFFYKCIIYFGDFHYLMFCYMVQYHLPIMILSKLSSQHTFIFHMFRLQKQCVLTTFCWEMFEESRCEHPDLHIHRCGQLAAISSHSSTYNSNHLPAQINV